MMINDVSLHDIYKILEHMLYSLIMVSLLILYKNVNKFSIAGHISHVGTFRLSGNRFIQGHSSTDVKREQVVRDQVQEELDCQTAGGLDTVMTPSRGRTRSEAMGG